MTVLHLLLAALPAFLASLVEFVEALTIVLAVGAVAGWRASLGGAAAGLVLLLALVIAFGRSLTLVPERGLEIVVGGLLLLFGLRWLRKACLRAAGAIPLRDESAAFERMRDSLQPSAAVVSFDWTAGAASFNGVVLEGVEVIFIVIALGSTSGAFAPAATGALAALVCVAALGFAVHRPLQRVPENALKLVVGIMLCAFGTLWLGEALRVRWPGGDAALLGLVAGYGLAAAAAVAAARRRVAAA